MSSTILHTKDDWQIGAPKQLSDSLVAALVDVIEKAHTHSDPSISVLGGRGSVCIVDLPVLGKVVIKQYLRGGLLGGIITHHHFRINAKTSRAQHEYEMLQRVRSHGVHAPEALCWITKGDRWYQGWLVTQAIEGAETLAVLSTYAQERSLEAVHETYEEIQKLMKLRVHHIDLHPGNVLVHPHEGVSLIDFDKAQVVSYSLATLRQYYLRRWRRAVIKHGLPPFLSELMCLRLRETEACR